jgi:hypothetical protein
LVRYLSYLQRKEGLKTTDELLKFQYGRNPRFSNP